MAHVLSNGPTVARFRIDRMELSIPTWNLKGKRVGGHSYDCNGVIPGRLCFRRIFTILLHKWEVKFPFHFRQKTLVCASVTRTFIKLNQQAVCGLETESHRKENPFRLFFVCCFFLACGGTFLLKRMGLLWFGWKENWDYYRLSVRQIARVMHCFQVYLKHALYRYFLS